LTIVAEFIEGEAMKVIVTSLTLPSLPVGADRLDAARLGMLFV
jgi:hypothetical protein